MKPILFIFCLTCMFACQQNDNIDSISNSCLSLESKTVNSPPITPLANNYQRQLTAQEKEELRRYFPNLNLSTVTVTGESSSLYNCIAFSMGITHMWINPASDLSTLMLQYLCAKELYGAPYNYFDITPLAPGADVDCMGTSQMAMTHSSRYGDFSRWESKLGQYLRITHDRTGLTMSPYGEILMSFQKTTHSFVQDNYNLKKTIEAMQSPPLTAIEKNSIKQATANIPLSIRNKFNDLSEKWENAIRANPKTKFSPNTLSYKDVPEFCELKNMGQQIIPLIAESLINPENFHFLVLYDELQNDDNLKIIYNKGDIRMLEGEQNRAIRTLRKLSYSNLQDR